MSDAKHTPGPWTDYPMPTKTAEEAQANKKLAIASPMLLDALVTLLGFADSGDSGSYDYDAMIKAAHDAVKKARGFA